MFGLVAPLPRYKAVTSCFLAGIFPEPPRVEETVIPAFAGMTVSSLTLAFGGGRKAALHSK